MVDEAKNRKIIDVIIYIKDLTSPLVDKNYDNYIYIDQYGYLEDSYFKKYFTISDNYYSAKEIVLTINEEINFYKSDELIRDFTFTDPGGNYCLVNDVKILVIETRPPILELYTKTYKHYLGEELPDLLEFVKECYDYTDNPDDLVLTFNTNIDVNKIGLYEVSYKAYNKYINNQTTAELKIYVDFVSKNKSEIKNLEVKVGEKIDELNGIKLSKDIVSYEVFPKVVNTDTPGIKKRQYVLYDVRGNFEIIEQEIKVVTINKPLNYNTIIIINGLSFSFLILFTVIKRRKSDLF